MYRRLFKTLYLITGVLLLVSCVSGTEIPVDHYYRLKPASLDMEIINSPYRNDTLYINTFQVTGLLNNRNLLYIHADKPNEVKKYFYHQWTDNPSEMLRDHLQKMLTKTGVFAAIKIAAYRNKNEYLLNSRLERMEINYGVSDAELMVSIHFELLEPDGSVKHSKFYSTILKMPDREIYQLVEGYAVALDDIYRQLFHDLNLL